MKVFISHTKRDEENKTRDFAKELAIFLETKGIEVFFDEHSFRYAHSIIGEIIRTLSDSDKLIYVSTEIALDSNYVQTELKLAREKSVKLYPEPFIHVVSLQKSEKISHVPEDLSGSLLHISSNKSTIRLFYEIYFGLMGVSLSDMIRSELHNSVDQKWLILDKHEILDVYSNDGHTDFDVRYAVQNITNSTIKYSHNINYWLENERDIGLTDVLAETLDGEPLTVSTKIHDFRGEKTFTVKIDFPEDVPPSEVISFKINFRQNRAFNIFKGDQYTVDCEEKGYGRYRFDLKLPRNTEAEKAIVEIHDIGEKAKVENLINVATGRFSHILEKPILGSRHIIKFKCKNNV